MDWSKAKKVLIVIFLLLNIFLAINIILSNQGDSPQKKNSANAVRILNGRGVVLKCKIPEIKDSYRISYESTELDKNKIASILLSGSGQKSYSVKYGQELSEGSRNLLFKDGGFFTYTDSKPLETLNLADKEKMIKFCAGFLDELGLPVSEYYADEYTPQNNGLVIIKFKEKHDNYIIFSNSFEIHLTPKGITKLDCRMVKVDKNQSNKIKNIVPAYQILLRHYLQSNTTILSIDIGFECTYIEKGKSSSTYPVWRVRTQGGEDRFFSTMDGTEQKI